MTRPDSELAPTPGANDHSDQLSTAQLEHLAFLARLELKPAEEEPMRQELNELLAYFQQLQEVDTEGVEPMQRPLHPSDVLRADLPGEALPQAEVLALAPASEGGFVQLPRTLDTD